MCHPEIQEDVRAGADVRDFLLLPSVAYLWDSPPPQHPGLTEQPGVYCLRKLAAGKDPEVHGSKTALGRAAGPNWLRRGLVRKRFLVQRKFLGTPERDQSGEKWRGRGASQGPIF